MVEIIGIGQPYDPRSIPLATRTGRYIPNARRQQLAPSIMRAAVEAHIKHHSSLQVRSVTSFYNCVGMVFASRRTVVDEEYLAVFLKEDGYQRVRETEVVPGDIVIYKNTRGEMIHVGVVVEHTPDVEAASWRTRILSQWGADGEYFHDHTDVPPLLGVPVEFWSERRV